MNGKTVEIFWGTGGVGKTTLAASRAHYLATKKNRILLITIDPSKRLRQILGVSEENDGKVVNVSIKDASFDSCLFSPLETFKRILSTKEEENTLNNRILHLLMKPYGGMNEIMAVIEIQHHLSEGKYDTIILDTPPGKHFIDFLESTQKIRNIFDKKFIEVFKYLSVSMLSTKTTLFALAVKTGINKLLKHMKKVTGETFVLEFIKTISSVYENKDIFLSALEFEHSLQKQDFSRWFLVISGGQGKVQGPIILKKEISKVSSPNECLVFNKSLSDLLKNWNVGDDIHFARLKKTMQEREKEIRELGEKYFSKMLIFPDVLSSHPVDHVVSLSSHWDNPY